MPGENPFEGFEFPAPIELEPLEPYTGGAGNYGGYEEAYGGDGGDMPRLIANDWDKGAAAGGDLRAFRLYSLQQDSLAAGWECYITAGLVLDNHILNMADCDSLGGDSTGELEDAVEIRIPTIDGVTIIDPQCSSGWERPLLLLPDLPCWVYARFETDNHGNIIADSAGTYVQIVAYSEEKKSVNHAPPSPETLAGREGLYYWLLNYVCLETAGDAEVSHRHQSNILWPGEFGLSNDSANVGSRIYRKFDRCKGDYKLRQIYGCYAITDIENDELIQLDFAATNVGVITGTSHPAQPGGYAGANVYVDSANAEVCGEESKFRKLVTSDVALITPQIIPVQVENTVEIRGNSKIGQLRVQDCDSSGGPSDQFTTLIDWMDGLITTDGTVTFKAGCSFTAPS